MSKVLVTGAGGFIGYHLTKQLIDRGCNILCIDNFKRIPKDEDISILQSNSKVEWLESSLEDLDLNSIMRNKFDYVFHLATINGTDNFYENPFTVLDSIVTPTLNLLKALKNNQDNLKRFFLASTSEVYASMTELKISPIPTPENTPVGISDITNSRWSYAAGKICVESATIGASKQFGLPWTIGRYHNVYGPRMGNKHFIPDFINRVKEQKYFIYGAEQTRCFTYYKDAINQTIELSYSKDTSEKIINIGNDIEYRVKDVAKVILDYMGASDQICRELPGKNGSVSRRVPDLKLNKSIIKNTDLTSLKEGIKETILWYESHIY